MSERTGGLYRLLSSAWVYSAYQNLIGAGNSRERFVREHVRAKPGDRILDIGCGPADILRVLPDVQYIGFDSRASYIKHAREKYGQRGTFYVGDVEQMQFEFSQGFDIVIADAVLHHLNDDAALQLLNLAYEVLVEHGRLVTLDCVFAVGQSRFAHWLIVKDRGRNVRTESELRALASRRFPSVKTVIRHDHYRIPYTLIIMECMNKQSGGPVNPDCV